MIEITNKPRGREGEAVNFNEGKLYYLFYIGRAWDVIEGYEITFSLKRLLTIPQDGYYESKDWWYKGFRIRFFPLNQIRLWIPKISFDFFRQK